jgi:hypothetical protein
MIFENKEPWPHSLDEKALQELILALIRTIGAIQKPG